jgi:hypothetical protein
MTTNLLTADFVGSKFRRLGFGKMLIIRVTSFLQRCRQSSSFVSTLFDHQAGVTAVDILQFEGEFSLQLGRPLFAFFHFLDFRRH